MKSTTKTTNSKTHSTETAGAIGATLHLLQSLLAQKHGTRVNTESGAATLSISHDQISLTDKRNRIVAFGLDDVLSAIDSPNEATGKPGRRIASPRRSEEDDSYTLNLWSEGQNQTTEKPWASFDIPAGWWHALIAIAKERGITESAAFEIAIREYLARAKARDGEGELTDAR